MKKSLLFLCLIIGLSIFLVSCGAPEEVAEPPAPSGGAAEESAEPSAPSGEPQYGGTLTVCDQGVATTPPSADVLTGQADIMRSVGPVLEHLLRIDYENLGPRGTGEWSTTWVVAPEWPMRGNLAESWEVAEDRLTFTIRQGVMWQAQGKEHVMQSRELTPDDIVFSYTRLLDSGAGLIQWTKNGGYIDAVYADGQDVIFELSSFNSAWPYQLAAGWMNVIYAPEVVEAGAGDWDNLVGTGPFVVEEYVEGSHISYVKNPDYWDTTTIDGVEYQVPFVDQLVYTTIADESSRVSALRTGQVDLYYRMPTRFQETIAGTNPDLESVANPWDWGKYLALKTNQAPLDNVEVRRALMMAIDLPAMNAANMQGDPGDFFAYPVHSFITDTHVPISELPASSQELFSYNPERAKEILAEQGYPDGFTLSGVATGEAEELVLAAGFWEQIGVTLEIDVVEDPVMGGYFWAGQDNPYDVGWRGMGQADALDVFQMYLGGHNWNWTRWANDDFDALWAKAVSTTDTEERVEMIKELSLMALDSVAYIPFGTGRELNYWWPWINNYYGESFTADRQSGRLEADIWIDQDLKSSMGFED